MEDSSTQVLQDTTQGPTLVKKVTVWVANTVLFLIYYWVSIQLSGFIIGFTIGAGVLPENLPMQNTVILSIALLIIAVILVFLRQKVFLHTK